ncbi:unnamed protein product [Rotaria sordida]|uniref:Helix-turn-helix domain-containing protein n=1 Tax=Rotaria sordida TaxID=392033 RepID=A0A815CXP2_9BILA|nr:unnamed protein product [Rotaria sordida]CAF1566100.1 unnamed protein product [Rotaria sordida]
MLPQEQALNSLMTFLHVHGYRKVKGINLDTIRKLASIVLQENVFAYGKKIYKQTTGGAMGSSFTLTLANIFMWEWQKKIIDEQTVTGEFYGRYIDDIFMTWNKSENELKVLLDEANTWHPNIKLDYKIGKSLPFLDVLLTNNNGILSTSVYHKPATEPYVTPFISDHPRHVFTNIIKTSLTRAIRYSSTFEVFNNERRYIKLMLLYNGYTSTYIEKEFHKHLSEHISTSPFLPLINNEKEFILMRNKLLDLPTPRQSQVAMSAATADIDNDQTDDQPIGPTEIPKKPETKQTNFGNKLFVHRTHEKRFKSYKQNMHRVYEDIFKDTPAIHAKLVVGNRNRRDTQNELIRKRPKQTLLQNTITKNPQGGKGPSDRYAAVLKSHVRRYLNEGHDVSTAAQFVAACASHGGVKNVHAFECEMTPTRSKTKVKINDITKLHNFIYESTAIRSYRAWNIGIGKMIMLDGNSRISPNINSLVCINPSLEPNRLINSSVGDRLNDTESSVPKDVDANDQEKSKPKLFFCDYEGCICRFLNYGNLLHHIVNGNHIERVEKLSMKDLAMITYKSKLDAAENQQLLFLELQRINFNRDDYNHIPTLNQGCALPLTRKVQTISPKVKQFLKKKFDDGQLHGIRWQPQAVVDEMKYSQDPETELYLFDLSELVKVSTVRSFFSRQKANNDKVNNPKPSTLEDNSLITGEQYDSEEDIEDEAFQEQLAIDLELQLGDIRSTANKDNMAEINLATATSKRALSSFENENLSHTRKSSRFPRKKGQ